MSEVVANADESCSCPVEVWQEGGVVPDRRPLATYLFCYVCGRVRARIMRVAFSLPLLEKHTVSIKRKAS